MPFSQELAYILLVLALFILPKALQRFRLPSAITSLTLGAAVGIGLGWFQSDGTINLLATLGIVSLFLFAGMEVDFQEIRREWRVIGQHLVIQSSLLLVTAWGLVSLTGLEARPAALAALALLTPSAGFILDSLSAQGIRGPVRFWVKSKVIATELVALAVLFFALQSDSPLRLGISLGVLGAMALVLPWLFRFFAKAVVPYAPKSEFTFVIVVALIFAFITRELGVYYLVGAFLVGVASQRFRVLLPALASENLLHAVEVFAAFFVPFYFFKAGLHLHASDFGWPALLAGLVFLALFLPLRVLVVALHRRVVLGEPGQTGLRIGLRMLPTLVFTLVLADILKARFEVPAWLFGGLIVYTLVNTLVPGVICHVPPPDYEAPALQELPAQAKAVNGAEDSGAGKTP